MLSPWQYLATDLPTRRGFLTYSGGRAGPHGVDVLLAPTAQLESRTKGGLGWRAGNGIRCCC